MGNDCVDGIPLKEGIAAVSYTHLDVYKRQPYFCDTGTYRDTAVGEGKRIMFEAQLGALRDIDFGIYPYTSSSSTIAAYGPIGAGIPQHHVDYVIGITKAYSTCVGEGPFTVRCV